VSVHIDKRAQIVFMNAITEPHFHKVGITIEV